MRTIPIPIPISISILILNIPSSSVMSITIINGYIHDIYHDNSMQAGG
jgi:hypothetical protein